MFTISDYQIGVKIYESINSVVYQIHRIQDDRSFILKVLKHDYPTPTDLAKYKQEYEITRSLHLEGVVKAYSLQKYQNTLAMVLEDFGGISLEILIKCQNLSLSETLAIVIQISHTLGQIHAKKVIHKDINPSNIIYNSTTKQVKIIDFGIATVLNYENPTIKNPAILEGTLAYMSPEQTGRMNRTLDERTDFYSLGVTFYHLLTYQRPFETLDPMELVHCHIAKQPIFPHKIKPEIPPIISQIVMKLMAKNAEERYQTAWGLKADLEECQRQLQISGKINSFTIATQDVSDRFEIPQKLYGREKEIETLLAAFERISHGKSELMLVAGYAGIGKSALVKEIYKPITKQRGYFIFGKFEQYQRDIPYSGIIEAFTQLIKQLLTENEESLETWREKILAALGINGQVIINVIPEVEVIIGSQPTIPELTPGESQNRFNLVFQNFISIFTKPEHPLVIFLDDLQWADTATLKLMQLLVMQNKKHLFLIGAYRDNEVNTAHPLMLSLDDIRESEIICEFIFLSDLNLDTVNQLIFESLKSSPKKTFHLAKLVLNKTNGNPFFIKELLKFIYQEKFLYFNWKQQNWDWDLKKINTCGITNNIVELMAGKIKKLSNESQDVLKIAACIGNEFDSYTLAMVYGKSQKETVRLLQEAVLEGLILPQLDTYKSVKPNVCEIKNELLVEYKFAHDRIQQAAYFLISETDKPILHQQLGQLLLQNTNYEQREEKIFDIVNQLNLGIELIKSQANKNELAELNLIAGKKAKVMAAYKSAFNYLMAGVELLKENGWQTHYKMTLNLYVEAAETALLLGDFETMDNLSLVVLSQTKNLLEKVKIYQVKIQGHVARNNLLDGIDTALNILHLLGIGFPQKISQLDIQLALEEIASKLTEKHPLNLVELPIMNNANKLAAMQIMSSIFNAAFVAKPELFQLIVLKMINLSVEYGNASLSAFAYANYGGILCGMGTDIDAGYQFGQLAIELMLKFSAEEMKAKIYEVFSVFIKHWKDHSRTTLKILLDGYKSGLEMGDWEFAALCAHLYCSNLYFVGENLIEVKQAILKYSEAIEYFKQAATLNYNQICQQVVFNLTEDLENSTCLNGDFLDEEIKLANFYRANDIYGIFYFYLHKAILSYMFEFYLLSSDCLANIVEYLPKLNGLLIIPIFYLYDSLIRLALYNESTTTEQDIILKKVIANQEKIAKWVHYAAMNYLHKFHLVEAELHRVRGEDMAAMEDYDRAIQLAKENEYLQEEALANELAAKFYLAKGKLTIARAYMQEARYCYLRWDATAKVKHLDLRYAHLLPKFEGNRIRNISEKAIHSMTTSNDTLEVLDFNTIIKASQALAGEVSLEKLLTKLMNLVLENAGAEKGFLILENESNLLIEASKTSIDFTRPNQLNFTKIKQSFFSINESLLPNSIINYVARMQEDVVLNHAAKEGIFISDSYIVKYQPKSVLCTPILGQGKLIGILYLENNLTAGAFTSERLSVLRVLTSQAAISLENARLYEQLANYSRNLEIKVKERTEELEKAKEAADTANRSKSEFLANMSHELRTPLNAILGFTQLINRERSILGRANEYLNIISRNGEHLLELINDVLDMSKIESGQMTLNEVSFDLYRLLTSLEEMFQLKAESKGLQLCWEHFPKVPKYVRADAKKLRQVLINLLSNAIKFTPQGRVTVRVKNQVESYFHNQCRLLFEVEDTGAGIAPDELDNLFKPFVQTETGKKSNQGTGLGLSISQQFVRLMGGKITVNSTLGIGTVFKFDIIVSPGQVNELQTEKSTQRVIGLAPDQPKYRILVVDDRWSNRQLLVRLLATLGFQMREAENGQEAVTLWESWEPHLIWMDMRMPVMDGYEATKEIKRHLKGQATVIIALTASAFEREKALVLSAGCDDFVCKPFQEQTIFEKIAEHLGVRYVYEETNQSDLLSELSHEKVIPTEALAVMPIEWLLDLRQAAIKLNGKQILQLCEEIPDNYSSLTSAIADLIDRVRFDVILQLAEQAINI